MNNISLDCPSTISKRHTNSKLTNESFHQLFVIHELWYTTLKKTETAYCDLG